MSSYASYIVALAKISHEVMFIVGRHIVLENMSDFEVTRLKDVLEAEDKFTYVMDILKYGESSVSGINTNNTYSKINSAHCKFNGKGNVKYGSRIYTLLKLTDCIVVLLKMYLSIKNPGSSEGVYSKTSLIEGLVLLIASIRKIQPLDAVVSAHIRHEIVIRLISTESLVANIPKYGIGILRSEEAELNPSVTFELWNKLMCKEVKFEDEDGNKLSKIIIRDYEIVKDWCHFHTKKAIVC